MTTPIMTSVIVTTFLLLLGIISFFLKQLLNKFDRVENSINSLNEKVAIIMTHQDHYQQGMEQRIIFEGRIDKEIKGLRDGGHEIRNIMNGLVGQIEILKDMKSCPHGLHD